MKKVFIVIVALCMGLGCLTDVANAYLARFEAEWADGSDVSPMVVSTDEGPVQIGVVSNELIMKPNGSGQSTGDPPASGGVYTFYAPAGEYKVMSRYVANQGNSFWMHTSGNAQTVNAGVLTNLNRGDRWWRNNGIPEPGWRWVNNVNDQQSNRIVHITLAAAGEHIIEVRHREDGGRLDEFYITDDHTTYPDEVGGDTRYDVQNLPMYYATNPSPGWEQGGVSMTGTKITWDGPFEAPPSALTGYHVYFGTTMAQAHTNLIASVPAAATREVDLDTAVGALVIDTTYYYRIDAYILAGGDANTAPGHTMRFNTPTNDPIITSQPTFGGAWTGDPVTFSIAAISGFFDDQGALSFQWYDASDDSAIAGETGDELTLTSGTDDGGVYCKVTNVTATVQSDTATLHVHKWVGHWTFDEGAGSIAHDTSPNDAINGLRTTATPNDAFIIAPDPAAIWTAGGMIGGAIELSRNNEFLDTFRKPSALGIGGNNGRTFSTWVFTKGFNNGGIYDMGRDNGTQDFCLRTLGGDNRWRLQYWGGDWSFNTMNRTQDQDMNMITSDDGHFPSKDAWVHFVHTHDHLGTNVYANGVHIVQWNGKELDTSDRYSLKIGSYHNRNGLNGDEFIGIIDDMRAYNFAMSHEEAVALYREVFPDAVICLSSNASDTDGDCDVDIDDLVDFVGDYGNNNIVVP